MKVKLSLLVIAIIMLCISGLQAQVTQEWAQIYNGGDYDFPFSMVTDIAGNVYVTGGTNDGAGTGVDFLTIKYNSSGVLQWSKRYNGTANGDDYAMGIAIDGSGNIYVTGSDVTIKYNSAGDSLWVRKYPGYAIANFIDGSDNIYVTGSSPGGGSVSEIVIIKYNSNGDSIWTARYDEDSSNHANSITVDETGNVYVTGVGIIIISGTYSADYVTVKYNSSGIKQWSKKFTIAEQHDAEARSIEVSSSGNVYVTGYFTYDLPPLLSDWVTIKYNSSGDQQWVQRYQGAEGAYTKALKIDGLENVYVTGIIGGTPVVATIKYNTSGNLEWIKNSGGGDLCIDDSDNLYSIGRGESFPRAITKYNSAGQEIWATEIIAAYNPSELIVDASENVYTTGGFYSFNIDYMTMKYSQLTGISQIINSNPGTFSLSQNYPNPFNPVTVIRYSLSENRFASLKIYDPRGKEVAALVNEKQNAGIYSVDWDAGNLPSGVYFYVLQAGEFTETKRMIFIK